MALIHNSNLEVRKLQYKGHWRYLEYVKVMRNLCCIFNSSGSRLEHEGNMSYYC